MYPTTRVSIETDFVRNVFKRSPRRRAFLFTPLAITLAWFALSATAFGVNPPPDGGYAGANTAEGTDALFSLQTSNGLGNTALGYRALYNTTIGDYNTAAGRYALYSNTFGSYNTASGNVALYSNTTGSYNTAHGYFALYRNETGQYNTASGYQALYSNTASGNTANGYQALFSNTTGASNTADGSSALRNNTTGLFNTATGVEALFSNTTGMQNTAHGTSALQSNTTGGSNTANGVQALFSNTTGTSNTASGLAALFNNTNGLQNTANGVAALLNNTTGSYNTANGVDALQDNTTGDNNTANGYLALRNNTTGKNNIALGASAGSALTTGNNNIDIGNNGVAGEGRTIRIGAKGTHKNTFIAGIHGVTIAGGVTAIIDNQGHLGTITSSQRFKDDIKPMDQASEAILELQPVSFRYKSEFDPKGIPQFGLVAEEVEKVNPDLVIRDDEGKAFTVRYEAVNAMLLNEFLKEHRKVTKLEKIARQQQEEIEALVANLKEQASRIQKVSDQLALNKPAPRLIAGN